MLKQLAPSDYTNLVLRWRCKDWLRAESDLRKWPCQNLWMVEDANQVEAVQAIGVHRRGDTLVCTSGILILAAFSANIRRTGAFGW